MSAILLPFAADGAIDWTSFAKHVERTAAAGLTPAVNMDTGYVQLLDRATRERVLDLVADHTRDFVAGAFIGDGPGDPFDLDAYRAATDAIAARGGVPVIVPSHGLNTLDGPDWVRAHEEIARGCDRFIAFELGPMFVPYGRIQDLDAYGGLLGIGACIGAKHSSLSRALEWDRLGLRDRERPDFLVLTGNDLAIDMVMYGSDYLLGLSTFAPDLFARRDALWEAGDPAFYELNDVLQYLGFFAFRDPVPAYKHDAAMFLRLRGWATSDRTHPRAPERPESDRAVLAEIAGRLGVLA
jgi:dihydrodipicolinate synthase/N-acetylneuraminate lyase